MKQSINLVKQSTIVKLSVKIFLFPTIAMPILNESFWGWLLIVHHGLIS